jgi:hypothetical protein
MGHISNYTHNEKLEALARKEVGSGTECGYFVSISNHYMEYNDDGELEDAHFGDESIRKMLYHYTDLDQAINFANGLYIGEDIGIGTVTIEGADGEIYDRHLVAEMTITFKSDIIMNLPKIG